MKCGVDMAAKLSVESLKLIDVLDEMNWKESTTNQMVIDKLERGW